MIFYFILTVCLASVDVCNSDSALFEKVEVTEAKECVDNILEFGKWIEIPNKNPESDRLTFRIKCHIIQEKLG